MRNRNNFFLFCAPYVLILGLKDLQEVAKARFVQTLTTLFIIHNKSCSYFILLIIVENRRALFLATLALTLLQYVADQLRVAVLGGYVERRAASAVSDQQADAATHKLRQLVPHTQSTDWNLLIMENTKGLVASGCE